MDPAPSAKYPWVAGPAVVGQWYFPATAVPRAGTSKTVAIATPTKPQNHALSRDGQAGAGSGSGWGSGLSSFCRAYEFSDYAVLERFRDCFSCPIAVHSSHIPLVRKSESPLSGTWFQRAGAAINLDKLPNKIPGCPPRHKSASFAGLSSQALDPIKARQDCLEMLPVVHLPELKCQLRFTPKCQPGFMALESEGVISRWNEGLCFDLESYIAHQFVFLRPICSNNRQIFSARHAVVMGPSLTGCGKLPSRTPAHQED